MRMYASLVTLSVVLVLFGLGESRLGEAGPDESTLLDQQEDATIDEREQERNLQQGARPFSNPNALDENENFMRVMVGFKNENGRGEASRVVGRKWMREMKNIRVATMLIPRASLVSLQSNPNIAYVEEDGIMTPDSEYVPFGITMTKGDSSLIPAAQGSSSACSDLDSFKVAIIDSGLQVGHPDIPCLSRYDPNTNCKGVSIGIGDLPWYDPKGSAGHGTHVFGTIGAIGGNNEGVTSMVPNSDGICYLIARVFDDEQNGIYASSIFEAIDWAVTEGANVINMSLGAGSSYQAGQDAIDAAHENGILSVASAGNSRSSDFQYPASFDHVISVAAVDSDRSRASFSTYNNKVDVAAPGVGTVSTYINNRYASLSGTSMAAPHVTGAIAKVWSVCRQCSSAKVENCLITTASSYPSKTNQLGFGIIDATDMYSCLVTDGCCAETTEQPVASVPEVVEPVVEPEPVVAVPEQVQAEPTRCNQRDVGERCRRDRHCCSGKCSTDMTCQAA